MPTPLETIDARIIKRYHEILKQVYEEQKDRMESRLARLAVKGQDTKTFKKLYDKELKAIDQEIIAMKRLLKRDLKAVTVEELTKEHKAFWKKTGLVSGGRGTDRLKNVLSLNIKKNFGKTWLNRIDGLANSAGIGIKRATNEMLDAVSQQIQAGQISGLGVDATAKRIKESVFGLVAKGSPLPLTSLNYQLQSIVRTTSTHIDTNAKDAYGQADKDIVAYKVLVGPGPDPDDICETILGGAPGSTAIIPKDDFARPPYHYNCNCIIQGYVRSHELKLVEQGQANVKKIKSDPKVRKMYDAAKNNDMAALAAADKARRAAIKKAS